MAKSKNEKGKRDKCKMVNHDLKPEGRKVASP